MLSTYTTFVFCHLLKHIPFIKLLAILKAYVYMQITIPNVAVPEYKGLGRFS